MLASFFSSFIQLYSMIICITDIQRTAHINVHNFMSLLYSGFHDNIKGTGIATVSQSFLMFLCFCFICFLLSLFFFFVFWSSDLFWKSQLMQMTLYICSAKYQPNTRSQQILRQWRYLWDVLTKLSHNTAKPLQLMSGLLNCIQDGGI